MQKAIYIMVTKDEYELPMAIADTVKELSVMTGKSENAIRSGISKQKQGYRSRFYKIETD